MRKLARKRFQFLSLLLVAILTFSFVSSEHALPSDLVDDDTALLEGMGQWANDITEGAFWTLMLLGFCVVLILSTLRYGVARAFGYGATTGLLGAISLAIIGWIPWWIASVFIVVGAASIAFMMKAK